MANEEIRLANIETALRSACALFIENGIYNTTREMLSRASGISRRSLERYFPSMTDCVVQTAEWFGREVYENLQAVELLEKKNVPACKIFRFLFDDLRRIYLKEPRIFACYAEFKAYLYRNSEQRDVDYRKFMDAVGFRIILKRIFELGAKDGTVKYHYTPESDARYLTNAIISYFSSVVLLYDTQPELAKQYIDTYIEDTLRVYCVAEG